MTEPKDTIPESERWPARRRTPEEKRELLLDLAMMLFGGLVRLLERRKNRT